MEFRDVTAHYGEWAVISNLNLTIRPGEFFSILGPSGCGKTTILRLIAGFLMPSSGMVAIGDENMKGIGPDRRPTAMIFQNLALFPLMTVWENIAFGLKYRGVPLADRRKRAGELLDKVSMSGQAGKRVSELSGGQRQRVAIARALAVEPAILLLDEPLSALDLKLRQHMRAELRHLQKQTGVTFIYITHDQSEALNMADRVAVMSNGRIEQIDEARRIYENPTTPFVAQFVGEANRFAGQVVGTEGVHAVIDTQAGRIKGLNRAALEPGDRAIAFVRPERSKLACSAKQGLNSIACAVIRSDYDGAIIRTILAGPGATYETSAGNEGDQAVLAAGEKVFLTFTEDAAIILAGEEIAP
ncbi:MAG TPA: ABC transporter ATP-binding protein [Nordella sp.]|nr:ABC transporter ATP-binding protein [Nordella sp.]